MSHPDTQSDTHSSADARLGRRLKDTPVAIVGMSSLFANAKYLDEFWDLIVDKIDAITQVPDSHWDPKDYFDADPNTPDRVYCQRGGFLPEMEFNPLDFGLPPNILEQTDTAQLLSLLVARDLLIDAGIEDEANYDRNRVGITLGIGGGQKISQAMNARLQYPVLKKIFKSSGISDDDCEMLIRKFQDQYIPWQENAFPGSLGNVIAGRIANRFNLGGMNCVVDAACAGSLAAMRMALGELLEGRSDMMLTGGVCTDNSPYMYMSFSKTPAFTKDDNIKPFDADSKGMMIGEGIGMLALKRLEDAERDGDRIYAVIKGIGASSDGRFKSIYAPRPEGQAKALARAYDDAGFAPHTVGLIEAHGTGTAAGDIAEFNGLNSVFSQDESGNPRDEKQHIALGSVKSQVGHTKSTAGTAGVIKAALALHHKVLPPTINVSKPNPKMALEDSAFYLSTQASPWLIGQDNAPRRAGISSFGFGGTNFHIVLEEYQGEHSSPYRLRRSTRPLLFSAPSVDALSQTLSRAIEALVNNASEAFDSLCQEFVLAPCNDEHPRLGIAVSNPEELSSLLSQALDMLTKSSSSPWQTPNGVSYRPCAQQGKLAALFTGQGNQYLQMGLELACLYPEQRNWLEKFNTVFKGADLKPLSRVMYPFEAFDDETKARKQAELTDTRYAQSAIGALSAAQYELMRNAGLKADMLAGHSYGELTALWASGAISDEAFCQLSLARGQAMALASAQEPKGSMAAVVLGKQQDRVQLDALLEANPDVAIANLNSPSQLVIAGEEAALTKVITGLKAEGIKAVALNVAGAFHTPMMAQASIEYNQAISEQSISQADIQVWSNQTGQPYGDDIVGQLSEHMLSQVDYVSQIKGMIESGARTFVEFGPKNTQSKLVSAITQEYFPELKEQVITLSLNPTQLKSSAGAQDSSDKQLKLAAVQLAVAGQSMTDPDTWAIQHKRYMVKPSPMNIRLNGAHYVSPATREKASLSLQQGQISLEIRTQTIEKVVEKIVEKPQSSNLGYGAEHSAPTQSASASSVVASSGHMQAPSGSSLESLFGAQSEAAKVHQAFLDIPKQYNETFNELMQAQLQLAKQGQPVPESLQRSIELFHQHQADTLRVHQAYLAQMSGSTQSSPLAAQVLPQAQSQTQPAVSAPSIASTSGIPTAGGSSPAAPAQTQPPGQSTAQAQVAEQIQTSNPVSLSVALANSASISPSTASEPQQDVTGTLLAVVADKTGYPTEMLELSMDMEADLGIDSIKRVEILGAVQEALPQLPALSPDVLAECRTLEQVQQEILNALPVQTAAESNAGIAKAQTAEVDVQSVLMGVVADKTGYPTEMLELSMDMEADLGIDSIKRVEILGAVQEALPQLPALSPDVLAECRTLEQVQTEIISTLPAQTAQPSIANKSAANTSAATVAGQDVQPVLMSVVADKTGYPAEMLELSMDMEADLGIDSIKRVEILGAVQEALPSLPALSPEAMAECRTLAEICILLSQSAPEAPAQDTAQSSMPESLPTTADVPESHSDSVDNSSHSDQDVIAVLLNVVADKTGYPAEMLELSMDMEADLGIDSIKRVEILGAVQEALPNLPSLSPDAMAECRTLAEITVQSASASPATPQVSSAQTAYSAADNTEATDESALPPYSGVALRQAPDALSTIELPKDGKVLLLDDGHHAGVIAEKLKGLDLSPVVLSMGTPGVLASDISQFTVSAEAVGEETLEDELAAIVSEMGDGLCGLVILTDPTQSSEQQLVSLRAGTLLAKLASPHLKASTPSLFATVTRQDGGFGYLKGTEQLLSGGLHGLCKTLRHEWPQVHCKALDVDADIDGHTYASALIAELTQDTDNTETGVSEQDGNLIRLTPVAASADLQDAITLDDGDTILVSGGAKGVTLDCALELARRSGSHFVLLGRSALPESLPLWAQNKASGELKAALLAHMKESGKKLTPKELDAELTPIASAVEIHQALEQFTLAGASAEYLAVDITDAKQLDEKLSPLAAIRPFNGLIHGAGVLADKLIEEKTLSQFNRVFDTKVIGLQNLLALLTPSALKFVSLFSSAAGFYGNSGQSDYSMANEVLNRYAISLKAQSPECKVTSFNWGPWDGGMVTAGLKAMFESRGVYVIPRNAGAKLFAQQVLEPGLLHCLVGTDMQGTDIGENRTEKSTDTAPNGDIQVKKPEGVQADWQLTLQNNEFLKDHSILGNPVMPTACALSLMLDSLMSDNQQPQNGDWTALGHYQLLKGLVFDDKDTAKLSLESLSSDSGDKLLLSVDGRPGYRAAPVIAGAISTPAIPKRLLQEYKNHGVSGRDSYQQGPLFHGPGLQLLTSLAIKESQLLANVSLPANARDFGDFSGRKNRICALDAILQGALVLAHNLSGQDSLPVGFAQLAVNKQLDSFNEGRLWLHNATLMGNSFQCDASLFADTGETLAVVKGVKLTLSSTRLNASAQGQAAESHKFENQAVENLSSAQQESAAVENAN